MILNLIFRETYEARKGNTTKLELIEADENAENAAKAAKLYTLQLPVDLRNTVAYKTIQIKSY